MRWFDLSFAARGFVIMTALGLSQAYREPVFDPGMVWGAFIAGAILGAVAGCVAPPLRWLKARIEDSDRRQPSRRGASMIERKLPHAAEMLGKSPKKAVLHNLGARYGPRNLASGAGTTHGGPSPAAIWGMSVPIASEGQIIGGRSRRMMVPVDTR